MKIKSLILGSAAALLAVSGARAADAVMAPEPEPVDYVRVCDAYGAGFFYIPGTQTCLSINGYVWWQVGATSQKDDGDSQGYYFGPSAKTPSRSIRMPSCATCSISSSGQMTSRPSCWPVRATTSAPAATCTRSSGRWCN